MAGTLLTLVSGEVLQTADGIALELGNVPSSGNLTTTLGAAALTANGRLGVTGNLAKTFNTVALIANGGDPLSANGNLTRTFGAVTLTASGSAPSVTPPQPPQIPPQLSPRMLQPQLPQQLGTVSNILALPLVKMSVETGNNEDWIESIKYIVGPENVPNPPQVDLRGIRFEMEIRRSAADATVVLRASTEKGTIGIGTQPDVGYLLWRIPSEEMKQVKVGSYVGDILAKEDFRSIERVTVQFELTIREGVTK